MRSISISPQKPNYKVKQTHYIIICYGTEMGLTEHTPDSHMILALEQTSITMALTKLIGRIILIYKMISAGLRSQPTLQSYRFLRGAQLLQMASLSLLRHRQHQMLSALLQGTERRGTLNGHQRVHWLVVRPISTRKALREEV